MFDPLANFYLRILCWNRNIAFGQCCRDVIVAVDPRDFLNEVDFARNVSPERRHSDVIDILSSVHVETETLQNLHHF